MAIRVGIYVPNPELGVSKNEIFLKIVSKILENHQNGMGMCYKYMSRYVWPLGSGLDAFLYDFQKIIVGFTSPPSPRQGVYVVRIDPGAG